MMNLFFKKHKEQKKEYINVSGKFLNDNPTKHKFGDFHFNEESIYKCTKDKDGIIDDCIEY